MNKVVILDITFGGYGVVKSLAPLVPIIGFYNASEAHLPEVKTELCDLKYAYSNEEELLLYLDVIASGEIEKPVLILTSDKQVEFFNNHREFFEERFLVNEPDSFTIDALLNKPNFHVFAKKNGFLVPLTKFLFNTQDVQNLHLKYPVFVKPAFKWSNISKGQICNNYDEIVDLFQYTDKLVAQEIIPGPTKNIYTVYVYFYSDSNWQCTMTAKKIREWPTFGGTASCLELISDPEILKIAINFFKLLKYKGFGSLEIKMHENTGELYLIEATVGRVDENSDFVKVNGMNMPVIHYSHVTGINYPQETLIKFSRPKYWIHELLDFQSSWEMIKKNPKAIFGILKTYLNARFHLCNCSDTKPFWYFFKTKILKIR